MQICGQYWAHRCTIISAGQKREQSPLSKDKVVLVVVVVVCPEGASILPLLMAMTQSVLVGELFMVFMAEESVSITFQLLHSPLRSKLPCIRFGEGAVAGEADTDWRLLRDMM